MSATYAATDGRGPEGVEVTVTDPQMLPDDLTGFVESVIDRLAEAPARAALAAQPRVRVMTSGEAQEFEERNFAGGGRQ